MLVGSERMSDFYYDILHDLFQKGVLTQEMRIAVFCGGLRDRETLLRSGLRTVTISNVDSRMTGQEYAPFAWAFQDVERIDFKDESFDFCIAADGLHHCQSPHRALLEMYRVARLGVIVLEPRDSFLTRLGVRLGFGQDYETAAVHANAAQFGGIRNTEIPNFVYRWTEREIEKTINCHAPWGRHKFWYWYKLQIPWGQLRLRRSKAKLLLVSVAHPFLRLFTWLLPGQSNNFAFAVFKPRIPEDLQPWITADGNKMRVNRAWLEGRYGPLPAGP
jgi:SAM-dependent methyltransferase